MRIFHEFREPRRIKRNPGRGSQQLRRALGGTRILLAAAPTAPPCFCRWQRSALLHRGFFARRTIRRVLRVALAAFSAAPWQGFEKAERCPSLASLLLPQAVVIPPSPEKVSAKQKIQYPVRILDFLVGAGGFEPPKLKAADLQSVPIGHSGTRPYSIRSLTDCLYILPLGQGFVNVF